MEPALSNRLTKLDVTARIWESVFPILSGIGVVLIGLLIALGYWAGEASIPLGGVVSGLGAVGAIVAARVLRTALAARRVLSQEPWVERRVDYYIDVDNHYHGAVWVRPDRFGPEELLLAYVLPIERRRWLWIGEEVIVWMAGSGKWRVISPVGGGKPRLARRTVPGDAKFGKLVAFTPRGKDRADRLIDAAKRDAG
ncbi:hypothetical protein [Alloactinosynnema sp. L-07]|uniref:hypothetical protein n=1 Tax=Alloactinosynnema sp. L-07 TaxID=1653480 RepID=UPI0012F99E4E|nr:hypothetical protein [Alloactinosynnema sp. L-07]